ncbi:MAG: zinc-dependent metalloprotease [Acidimicrobiales bacterium]
MSTPQGFGPGGPFEGGPFSELMRNIAHMFTNQGPLNWEVAAQMAQWAATEGQAEPNPDPVWRVRFEELLRVADMHVAEATGLEWPSAGLGNVLAITRSEWAKRTLEDWHGLFETLAARLVPARDGQDPSPTGTLFPTIAPGEEQSGDPLSSLFSGLPQMLGPFLVALQVGSMVGQLATRAMGQFDPLAPRPYRPEVVIVTSTVERFAAEWSLPDDDVRMWLCLHETLHRAVLGQRFVLDRLSGLVEGYVDAFSPQADPIEARLADLDISDMAGMQAAFADPSTLLAEMQNDRQRSIQEQIRAVLCALSGYVDYQIDKIGRRLVGSYPVVSEAFRRRRMEETPGTTVLAQLFGITLAQEDYEAARSFTNGVLERAGEASLSRLWISERNLPTPAELKAPGLWLARIDLPSD